MAVALKDAKPKTLQLAIIHRTWADECLAREFARPPPPTARERIPALSHGRDLSSNKLNFVYLLHQ